MTDTTNFGRHGEMPKPKRPFWRSSFGMLVVFLCIAGIIAASDIGALIIVVSMISLIGIPIAFLVMAIPTVALVAFTTWVSHLILRLFGQKSMIAAVGLALAFLVGYPPIHNFLIESQVKQLVESDRYELPAGEAPIIRGRVFGMMAYGRRHKCNSLCQRVLLAGQAKSYLAVGTRKNKIEPKFTSKGTAYSLVKRDQCTIEETDKNLKLLLYSNKDVPAELAMRDRLKSGYCFVVEKDVPVASADYVAHTVPRWGRAGYSVSHNPLAQLVSARRLGFHRKNQDGTFEIMLQQTPVDYSLLGPFVSFIYRDGAGLNLRSDIWRTRHRNYDRETINYDLRDYLTENVGIPLRLAGYE